MIGTNKIANLAAAKKRQGGGSLTKLYATWSHKEKAAAVTLSADKLTATSTNTTTSVRTGIGMSSGKHYWEIDPSVDLQMLGMCLGSYSMDGALGVSGSQAVRTDASSGYFNDAFVSQALTPPLSAAAIYGFAYDADAGKFWVSIDGVWLNSGDPAAGTNPLISGLTGEKYPAVSPAAGSLVANFGATPFIHAAPTGFRSGVYEEVEPTAAFRRLRVHFTAGGASPALKEIDFVQADTAQYPTQAMTGIDTPAPLEVFPEFLWELFDGNNSNSLNVANQAYVLYVDLGVKEFTAEGGHMLITTTGAGGSVIVTLIEASDVDTYNGEQTTLWTGSRALVTDVVEQIDFII